MKETAPEVKHAMRGGAIPIILLKPQFIYVYMLFVSVGVKT